MYDIKQFKPTLYIILVIGFTGFAMAAESPALWVFSTLGLALNAWLLRTDRFTPLPRWMANLTTIIALLYILSQIRTDDSSSPLMYIGQFLMLLQLIKLYEQRANRDYAQLLVLSILLMVAAAINTASLLFGVLMGAYLILVLYCCLLFHLKVEADRARTAFPLPPDQINPATLKLDQHFLPRSMRRLTGLVTVAALIMGVFVFLFFPRGAGQGVLGQLQFRPPQSLTGFNDRVNFEQIARITQNQEVVAHIVVHRDDTLVEGTQPLLLRGLTLDTYNSDPQRTTRTAWTRSYRGNVDHDGREEIPIEELRPRQAEIWRQKVRLQPTGTRYLFALQGLMWRVSDRERKVAVRSGRNMGIRYSPHDEALQTEPINVQLEYEVYSDNQPRKPDPFTDIVMQEMMDLPPSDPAVLAKVKEYAQRPDVLGALAQRKGLELVTPVNAKIASALEEHLQNNFTYTLDLTEEQNKFRDEDPITAFLTSVKKGHCEYFASAMTLMCQSLRVPARLVVGFKCDEYNPIGGHYVVRQSHAHTWVEVLTHEGWKTYDPTSGREAFVVRKAGFWQSVAHFFDYLEYKWAENVVAYDARNRENLIKNLDGAATNFAIGGSSVLQEWKDWFGDPGTFWSASLNVITLIITLMVAGMFVAITWFMVQQYRLRRRAQRIGLDNLPMEEQIRLARQLAFYDDFTTALQRHRIIRPTHQTPLEFASSLVFLPNELFDTACRLTQMFYRVRFGEADLTGARQRHLEKSVERFVQNLDASPPVKGQA